MATPTVSSKRLTVPRKQGGYTLLQVMLALAVVGYAAYMAAPSVTRQQQNLLRTATIGQINEIAQAAKTFYIDQVEAGTAACLANRPDCWPANLAAMTAADYLADGAAQNGFGLTMEWTPTGRTGTVSAQAPDLGQASTLALAFGGLATVDNSNPADIRVNVEYASPGIDAEHLALLDRDGARQMEGPIVFDMNRIVARALATGNTVLDLTGGGTTPGDIVGAGNIESQEATIGTALGQVVINQTGNLNAPSGIITTFTSDDIQVNNDIDVDGDLRVN